MRGEHSKSGVFVYDDYRDNLIIDRSHPVFAAMRGQKLTALRSENSEDAISWNVFRTLRRLHPSDWFRLLTQRAFGHRIEPGGKVEVELWQRVAPPPGRKEAGLPEEGESEVDIVISTPTLLWTIEAKYKSDVSLSTTHDPGRNQILRNIDVGSAHAGERDFYFSLLVLDASHGEGPALLRDYAADRGRLLAELPYRTDALANLKALGVLSWSDLAAVLRHCAAEAWKGIDRADAQLAVEWLEGKGIVPS